MNNLTLFDDQHDEAFLATVRDGVTYVRQKLPAAHRAASEHPHDAEHAKRLADLEAALAEYEAILRRAEQ